MSNYEAFKIVKLKRSEIKEAYYNPRLITDAARKKLKRSIKEHKLVTPIIVNKKTMNIVGGHQRVSILDEINKEKDYELTISLIDVTEDEEKKINVKLNNDTMSGIYDAEKLASLINEIEDIDPVKDLGFDKLDLDYLFANDESLQEQINYESMFNANKEQNKTIEQIKEIADRKNEYKKKRIELAKNGETDYIENDDYLLTIVFNCNTDKHSFMKRLNKKITEKYIKYSFIYDVLQDKYRN